MSVISITSTDQLRAWLGKHDYFKAGFCLVAPSVGDEPASGRQNPNTVQFELAYPINGAWAAGDSRTMRVFGCTALGVAQWLPGRVTDPYMDEGVRISEERGLLCLDLDSQGKVAFNQLLVETLPDRSVPIDPWTDPHQVSAQVASGAIPEPVDWINWFQIRGQDVAWRVKGGGEWPVKQMPTDAYAGFIQRVQDIPTTEGGVFVEVRPTTGEGFHLVLDDGERWARSSLREPDLWQIAREFLIQFPAAQICTGNCLLTSEQWARYIHEGVLPNFAQDASNPTEA